MRDTLLKGLIALAVFALATLFSYGTGHTGAPEGKDIFTAGNCSACHETNRPQKKATIERALDEKGPGLWYAGNKFRKEFLAGWLKDPKPIRPMACNSITRKNRGEHPALKAAEAARKPQGTTRAPRT